MKENILRNAWDDLHSHKRFLPKYPSESIVRFVFGNYPESSRRNLKILDLGCGGGRHTLFLAREGFGAFGTDISETGLSHARLMAQREGLKCIFKKAIMGSQPFKDNFFDGVISFGVLYYNDSTGYANAVREIRRILKKGGKALIVTRTTDDFRYGKGKKIEQNTYELSTMVTNEKGMPGHFLDRRSIKRMFKDFDTITIDRVDFTIGAVTNSDWIITVKK